MVGISLNFKNVCRTCKRRTLSCIYMRLVSRVCSIDANVLLVLCVHRMRTNIPNPNLGSLNFTRRSVIQRFLSKPQLSRHLPCEIIVPKNLCPMTVSQTRNLTTPLLILLALTLSPRCVCCYWNTSFDDVGVHATSYLTSRFLLTGRLTHCCNRCKTSQGHCRS